MRSREELRTALARADRSGTGRPYPETLRREAVAYVEARCREGASRDTAARELGVSTVSVARWSMSLASSEEGSFRQVVVMSPCTVMAQGPGEPGQLVVFGPHGMRIEGLDMAGVAELWRRLG